MRIDQFRYDYLLRFRDQYTGGLSRLLNEGAVFDNAYLERYPTVTAIGHATALTGATPALSGIVGNDWYDRESHKRVFSVSDEQRVPRNGGYAPTRKNRSPEIRFRKTHSTQFVRNFSMDQPKHISAQTVFKIGDFTVPLDFEAARCYLLLRQTLMAKDSPRDH